MDYIDEVYYTLTDDLTEEAGLPWVARLTGDGEFQAAMAQWYVARNRLCRRLNEEKDPDMEQMTDAMLCMQRCIGRSMFLCGMRFRNET